MAKWQYDDDPWSLEKYIKELEGNATDAGNIDYLASNPFLKTFQNTVSPRGGSGGGGLPYLNWGEPIQPIGSASSRALTPGMMQGAVTPSMTTSTNSSWISKLFGKGGLDPTALALGGLSLFGGDEPNFQPRETYSGQGVADPVASLTKALEMLDSLSGQMAQRGPIKLNSTVASGPGPVSIPGVPFQIGGGLGTDPALRNPDMLEFPRLNLGAPSSISGSSMSQSRPRQGPPSGQAKRRNQ